MDNALCAFGCGRVALTVLKSGKAICATSANQCPVLRERNSAAKRGKDPWAGRRHPRGMAGKPAWNRGLTWEQMFGQVKADHMRSVGRLNAARAQSVLQASPEIETRRRQKLSAEARRRGLGGYERGSGRGKKGWYRGHWCDSTYELAFVVYLLDHEIEFVRNVEVFPYEYQDQVLYWIPDFLLADGTYIEIKGYVTPQALAKFEFFYRPLRVLTEADLRPMFEYVHQKYGRKLVALYE